MAIINIKPESYKIYEIIIENIEWEEKAEVFIQQYN